MTESSDDGLPDIPVSTPFNLLPFSQQADIVRFALEQAQCDKHISAGQI